MFNPKYLMSFDVESVGLHGEGFAVGWVVVDLGTGLEVASGMEACDPDTADGTGVDRIWIQENIPDIQPTCPNPLAVRNRFWSEWHVWKSKGAVLAADCPWPVEARFLMECIRDRPDRAMDGPYPLIGIESLLWSAGMDPLGTYIRRGDEEKHNPLGDARQSARVMANALKRIATWREAYRDAIVEITGDTDGGVDPEDFEAAIDKCGELEEEARRDPGA